MNVTASIPKKLDHRGTYESLTTPEEEACIDFTASKPTKRVHRINSIFERDAEEQNLHRNRVREKFFSINTSEIR